MAAMAMAKIESGELKPIAGPLKVRSVIKFAYRYFAHVDDKEWQLTIKDGLETSNAALAVMGKYSKLISTVHHSAQLREFFEKTVGSCRPILCRFYMFNMLMFLLSYFQLK